VSNKLNLPTQFVRSAQDFEIGLQNFNAKNSESNSEIKITHKMLSPKDEEIILTPGKNEIRIEFATTTLGQFVFGCAKLALGQAVLVDEYATFELANKMLTKSLHGFEIVSSIPDLQIQVRDAFLLENSKAHFPLVVSITTFKDSLVAATLEIVTNSDTRLKFENYKRDIEDDEEEDEEVPLSSESKEKGVKCNSTNETVFKFFAKGSRNFLDAQNRNFKCKVIANVQFVHGDKVDPGENEIMHSQLITNVAVRMFRGFEFASFKVLGERGEGEQKLVQCVLRLKCPFTVRVDFVAGKKIDNCEELRGGEVSVSGAGGGGGGLEKYRGHN